MLKILRPVNYLPRRFKSLQSEIPTIMELRVMMEKHVAAAPTVPTPEFDPTRAHPPSASATRCIIPLSTHPKCQVRYMNASGYARSRFGVLLEDLDMFAVWLAFRHNQPIGVPMGTPAHHPMLIVTACVDRIGKLQ